MTMFLSLKHHFLLVWRQSLKIFQNTEDAVLSIICYEEEKWSVTLTHYDKKKYQDNIFVIQGGFDKILLFDLSETDLLPL